MIANIECSTAKGSIKVPPSKSMAHRYMICAALSTGSSKIENVDFSQDILATLDCIESIGAKVDRKEDSVIISGIDLKSIPKEATFMCRESGSTMRFFMGIAMCLGIKAKFYGSETLRNRPFGVYEDICEKNSIVFVRHEDFISIEGRLNGGIYTIPGNISSQFITGLMFGLPLLGNNSGISILPPVESRSYINLTIQSMCDFGISIGWEDEQNILILGNQSYTARDISVEGDYSNAAFLDAFNYIGGDVSLLGLRTDSLQGDRVYGELFEKLSKESCMIDISDCPDLGPILFAIAAANFGGVFTGTKRLKMKESDRGRVMCEELSKFGVICQMEENEIKIGIMDRNLAGIHTCGHNDHRIVMSMAVLLSITGGSVDEAEAVRKSYPGFFENIKSLGIEVK